MDSVLIAGFFGLGGVALGSGLNALTATLTRKRVSAEQREQARHARELVAAEHLDEALVAASGALDAGPARALDERYSDAHDAWQDGWVRYSPRLHEPRLLARYEVVGSILKEVVLSDRTPGEVPRHIVAQALANARASLGYFMRGEALPPSSFPDPPELQGLLARGDGTEEPVKPLREWLREHQPPEFHGPPPELGRPEQDRLGPG